MYTKIQTFFLGTILVLQPAMQGMITKSASTESPSLKSYASNSFFAAYVTNAEQEKKPQAGRTYTSEESKKVDEQVYSQYARGTGPGLDGGGMFSKDVKKKVKSFYQSDPIPKPEVNLDSEKLNNAHDEIVGKLLGERAFIDQSKKQGRWAGTFLGSGLTIASIALRRVDLDKHPKLGCGALVAAAAMILTGWLYETPLRDEAYKQQCKNSKINTATTIFAGCLVSEIIVCN